MKTKAYCESIPQIPNTIPNVQINTELKFKTGTEIEYQCDFGYSDSAFTESNNNKVTCLDNGKWSQASLKCNRIKCEKPEEIENGIIKANDYFHSSVIEYKCVPGYYLRRGDYLRECDLNGNWTGTKPSCERKINFIY